MVKRKDVMASLSKTAVQYVKVRRLVYFNWPPFRIELSWHNTSNCAVLIFHQYLIKEVNCRRGLAFDAVFARDTVIDMGLSIAESLAFHRISY